MRRRDRSLLSARHSVDRGRPERVAPPWYGPVYVSICMRWRGVRVRWHVCVHRVSAPKHRLSANYVVTRKTCKPHLALLPCWLLPCWLAAASRSLGGSGLTLRGRREVVPLQSAQSVIRSVRVRVCVGMCVVRGVHLPLPKVDGSLHTQAKTYTIGGKPTAQWRHGARARH